MSMLAFPVSELSGTELIGVMSECSAEIERRETNIRLGFADLSDRIHTAYTECGKIPAIKLFRELTFCGLKEAKLVVEAMAAALDWTSKP